MNNKLLTGDALDVAMSLATTYNNVLDNPDARELADRAWGNAGNKHVTCVRNVLSKIEKRYGLCTMDIRTVAPPVEGNRNQSRTIETRYWLPREGYRMLIDEMMGQGDDGQISILSAKLALLRLKEWR
ncbi:MAG: hypothetical protein KAV00_07115 [Phycisphaerae bacterium]|nr:hypothetical protein [Phycisphaerae bacterium]